MVCATVLRLTHCIKKTPLFTHFLFLSTTTAVSIIRNQGIKSTLLLYIGVVVGVFNLLWLFPKFLSPAEIGLTGVLVDAASLFMPFVLMGSTSVLVRFYPHYKHLPNPKAAQAFVTWLMLVPLVGFGLFGVFFMLYKNAIVGLFMEKSPLFIPYIAYVVPLCLFLVYYNVLENYGRLLHEVAVVTAIRDVGIRLATVLVVLAYYWQWIGIDAFVAWSVAVFGLAVVALGWYFRQSGNLRWSLATHDVFDDGNLRQMVRFAGFVFLGSMGSMLVGKIDSLMIARYVGLEQNGVYRIAFYIGLVIEMPRRALSQISGPMIAEQIKHQNWAWIEQLYRKIAINQLVVGLFFFMLIWCNIDALFSLMPNGSVYATGKYVVLFIGLAKIFDMATSINEEIIAFSQYYYYALVVMLLLIGLTVATNYWLIPLYGIVGSAMATALTILVYNIAKYFIIYYLFKMQPFTRATLKTLAVCLIVGAAQAAIPTINPPIADLAVRSAFITVLYAGLAYATQLSPDMNLLLHQLWHRLRQR